MTFQEFLQQLRRNWLLLLTVPLVTAGAILLFSRKEAQEYASNTTIYTGVASAFNIDKNNPGSDYTNNKAYSNLLSLITARATKQEVALRLLARHLSLSAYDSAALSPETYGRLKSLVGAPLRQQLVGSSLDETTRRLTAYLQSNNRNVVYKIINSDVPSYSLTALDKISASQVNNSDLVKIEYVSDDAAVCQQTLVELTDVFIRKHRELQEGQNESVVGYFGTATTKARRRLDAAEQNLLAFQRTNNLINYDEQSETIAAQKEEFEQQANELELQYAGAVSALKTLEKSLKRQGVSSVSSQEVYRLNNQLLDLHTQIANAEVFGKSKAEVPSGPATQALKEQAELVERQMEQSINKSTTASSSNPGISNKSLASSWINAAVLVDELKAKLLVMRRQRDSFGREYQKVAPLGAEMRKIQRERELAEKEYLAVMNNLGQSEVAQQNIELTSRLKVVDPPYLAANRAKSKRLFLILFGAFGTLAVTVGGIATAALMDQSLKSPALASVRTNLSVLGILPQKTTNDAAANPLFQSAEEKLARQLLLKMQQLPDSGQPCIVGVMSSHGAEGKSVIVTGLVAQLNAIGIKTLRLLPDNHAPHLPKDAETAFYSPLQGLTRGASFTDVLGVRSENVAVVIVEFPALLEATYPVALLQRLDLIVVAVKASRSWQAADKTLFENVGKATKAPLTLVLNGVWPLTAQQYLGAPDKSVVDLLPSAVLSELPQWPRQVTLHS